MDTFIIDVPMPSMGATVNEVTLIALKIKPGDRVTKGQKIAELETDKSVFEFEAPCDGLVRAIFPKPGDALSSGAALLQMETSDASLRHLEAKSAAPAGGAAPAAPAAALVWTPKALKLAQEAGLDPAKVTDIAATGPGGRVSGDDVARYVADRKS